MAITDNNGAVTFAGRVVKTYVDRDVRIMSDVWADLYFAVVYTPETKGEANQTSDFRSVCYRNSEFSGNGSAQVDAPQELIELYAAHVEKQRLERELREAQEEKARREQEHKDYLERVQKGRVVRVVKGRKVPVGIQGYVFWEGIDSYGTSKVGIATTTRKEQKPSRSGRVFESYVDVVFVAKNNCKVVGEDEASIQAAVDAFLAL